MKVPQTERWNLRSSMEDSRENHIFLASRALPTSGSRVRGFVATRLESSQCPLTPDTRLFESVDDIENP